MEKGDNNTLPQYILRLAVMPLEVTFGRQHIPPRDEACLDPYLKFLFAETQTHHPLCCHRN